MKLVNKVTGIIASIISGILFLPTTFSFAVSSFVDPSPLSQQRRKSESSSTCIMGIRGFRSWFESQFPTAISDMSKDGSHDEFDHVLIDMNQLLHVVLRKSRSDGHGLTMLMKELDACVAMATPQQSLVLAMDGPPGAAKLATQRQRRYATCRKTSVKVKQLDKMLDSVKGSDSKRSQTRAKQWTRKKRKALAETKTLCITPATEFMETAQEAILYWAWQRLSSRTHALSENKVKIFVSPSTVPGEGEVKLLEWIYSKNRRGESVAILGGDSDLVLEALVIPLHSTHNVFVLLPDGAKRYLSVSLWETTRCLGRLLNHASITDIIQIRTDLVLLLILNGNDYLPKLRGSSGFNKLFHTYLRLAREWHSEGKFQQVALVNPDTLEFNLPFCQAYFSRLASLAPSNLWSINRKGANTSSGPDRSSALQQLHNLGDAGFLPKPMEFQVVRDGDDDNDDSDNCRRLEKIDSDDDSIGEENSDKSSDDIESSTDDEQGVADFIEAESSDEDDDDEEEIDQIRVRLLLGEPGSEDFFTYEIWHPRKKTLKLARQKLAAIALADLLDEQSDSNEEDGIEVGDTTMGMTQTGYDWEIHHTVPGKVDSYLYGLLWNLQTYQDGVSADYSFNYGKRLSPLAQDIATFLEIASKEGRVVGPKDLSSASFSPSVSAGLSCLAALPAPVKHLVPEPYRWLADETVEEFYSSCMDPEDNVFDMKRFERLCEAKIRTLEPPHDAIDTASHSRVRDGHGGPFSDNHWTVISKVPKALAHPFDPPVPFSDRLRRLKSNNKIRVSKFIATAAPRPRENYDRSSNRGKKTVGFRHSDPGLFLSRLDSIEQVDYRLAYQRNKKKERRGIRRKKQSAKAKSDVTATPVEADRPKVSNEQIYEKTVEKSAKQPGIETSYRKAHSAASATEKHASAKGTVLQSNHESMVSADAVSSPPILKPVQPEIGSLNGEKSVISQDLQVNSDGETAIAVLKQLYDLELIGQIQWDTFTPSTLADVDPHKYELIRLSVARGKTMGTSVLPHDLVYEQDRHLKDGRKPVQQRLASLALRSITGSEILWSDVSYDELKTFLKSSKAVQS